MKSTLLSQNLVPKMLLTGILYPKISTWRVTVYDRKSFGDATNIPFVSLCQKNAAQITWAVFNIFSLDINLRGHVLWKVLARVFQILGTKRDRKQSADVRDANFHQPYSRTFEQLWSRKVKSKNALSIKSKHIFSRCTTKRARKSQIILIFL